METTIVQMQMLVEWCLHLFLRQLSLIKFSRMILPLQLHEHQLIRMSSRIRSKSWSLIHLSIQLRMRMNSKTVVMYHSTIPMKMMMVSLRKRRKITIKRRKFLRKTKHLKFRMYQRAIKSRWIRLSWCQIFRLASKKERGKLEGGEIQATLTQSNLSMLNKISIDF